VAATSAAPTVGIAFSSSVAAWRVLHFLSAGLDTTDLITGMLLLSNGRLQCVQLFNRITLSAIISVCHLILQLDGKIVR